MRAGRTVCGALAAFWTAVMAGVLLGTSGWVRGALGDVAVVAFLSALLGVARPASPWGRAFACFALGTAVEGFQALGVVDDSWPRWLQIAIGRTADWADVLAYALGGVLAVVGEAAGAMVRTARPG